MLGWSASFFETMQCDDVYDMSVHRNELETRIGKETLGRILACDDTGKDEKWIKIHTIDRATNTMATLGLIGLAYGALRPALLSLRRIKDKESRK